jgi:TatD DNase family protein
VDFLAAIVIQCIMHKIFDSHCHLDLENFSDDREKVLQRASKAGLCGLIIPGTTGSIKNFIPDQEGLKIYAAWGRHPMFKENYMYRQNSISEDFDSDSIVAIGECGLDKRYEYSIQKQLGLFEEQLKLANDLKLPVIVHLVGYWEEALRLADKFQSADSPWILHSFSGSSEIADLFLAKGCYLSFSGSLCHEKNQKARKVAKNAPFNRILIETDSPDMSPDKSLSSRNEPANLGLVFNQLTDLKKLSAEKMSEILLENTYNAFNLSNNT